MNQNNQITKDMNTIKDFIQILGNEKNKKREVANALYEFQEDLIRAYVSNAHMQRFRDVINELLTVLVTKKFIKGLKFALKKKNADLFPEGIKPGLVILLYAAIMKQINSEDEVSESTEELVDELASSVQKLLSVRIEEVGSKVDLPNEVLEEILVIAPEPKYLNNRKYIGTHISRLLNTLYEIEAGLEKEQIPLFADTDALKALFKALFGKDALAAIGINILLERKNADMEDNQLYNLLTEYSLEILNKRRDELEDALEYYITRRTDDDKRERDSERRIILSEIDDEKYPHLHEAIERVVNENKKAEMFFSK